MKQLKKLLRKTSLEKIFVDTNIFIHLLLSFDKKKHKACLSLFEKAQEGETNLWTTEWVIAELVWILTRNKIHWDKTKEAAVLILNTKGLEVRKRGWVAQILESCKEGEDFVDAVNISLASSEGIKKGYSYDKGFDKWKGFKRIEP